MLAALWEREGSSITHKGRERCVTFLSPLFFYPPILSLFALPCPFSLTLLSLPTQPPRILSGCPWFPPQLRTVQDSLQATQAVVVRHISLRLVSNRLHLHFPPLRAVLVWKTCGWLASLFSSLLFSSLLFSLSLSFSLFCTNTHTFSLSFAPFTNLSTNRVTPQFQILEWMLNFKLLDLLPIKSFPEPEVKFWIVVTPLHHCIVASHALLARRDAKRPQVETNLKWDLLSSQPVPSHLSFYYNFLPPFCREFVAAGRLHLQRVNAATPEARVHRPFQRLGLLLSMRRFRAGNVELLLHVPHLGTSTHLL